MEIRVIRSEIADAAAQPLTRWGLRTWSVEDYWRCAKPNQGSLNGLSISASPKARFPPPCRWADEPSAGSKPR